MNTKTEDLNNLYNIDEEMLERYYHELATASYEDRAHTAYYNRYL